MQKGIIHVLDVIQHYVVRDVLDGMFFSLHVVVINPQLFLKTIEYAAWISPGVLFLEVTDILLPHCPYTLHFYFYGVWFCP